MFTLFHVQFDFCGALTPGSLRAQNHCMPEPEVLCRTQNRRQWLTTAL